MSQPWSVHYPKTKILQHSDPSAPSTMRIRDSR
jgi:hypothetical protein